MKLLLSFFIFALISESGLSAIPERLETNAGKVFKRHYYTRHNWFIGDVIYKNANGLVWGEVSSGGRMVGRGEPESACGIRSENGARIPTLEEFRKLKKDLGGDSPRGYSPLDMSGKYELIKGLSRFSIFWTATPIPGKPTGASGRPLYFYGFDMATGRVFEGGYPSVDQTKASFLCVSDKPTIKVVDLASHCKEKIIGHLYGYGLCSAIDVIRYSLKGHQLRGTLKRYVSNSCEGVIADISLTIKEKVESPTQMTVTECSVDRFVVREIYSD